MTLVITRLAGAGIAMVADSMIAYPNLITGDLGTHRDYQQKLFKISRIVAGASYWGSIGHVIRDTTFKTFAEWFRAYISVSNPRNLKQFAEDLADNLNSECKQQPLPQNASMGVHVAGYQQWNDGILRPTLYHVHNGPLHTEWTNPEVPNLMGRDPTGRCILGDVASAGADETTRRRLLDGRILGRVKIGPRGLLEAHLDFPREQQTIAENEAVLTRGYVTTNGDYFRFSVRAQRDEISKLRIEDLPEIEEPPDANRSTDSLLQVIHTQAKTLIDKMRFEKPPATFGGRLWTLGINANGYTGCDKRL
ncbi:MAG: hypothetical protein WC378_05905 [Opitutaceae bacterium]|jgi:hypothetical protein